MTREELLGKLDSAFVQAQQDLSLHRDADEVKKCVSLLQQHVSEILKRHGQM
ncbi:hypothetical protein IMZ31_19460 (plasmid) [Pontibacillus sp. ALD_SL1]|uniref:hypothetical protein n=1 Tax=Pontibacillus sp. ALD_SL1 TaxID=2777185 RepID=UPI001A96B6B9|nr:hypothetical protein [Pontibacillus sp. ALD_SL1]QST02729.1 hypothetical protein IMZ31_19460 [Pontibacillus sp. ALD_SL1]